MSKIIVIAVICSFFLAIQAASFQRNDVTSQFVGNLTEFLRVHGFNKTLTPLRQNYFHNQITYDLGRRIQGDRLVATSSKSNSFASPRDITFSLAYPSGSVVSYVKVVVNQSSNLGRGVVLSGGINQRNITIAIEARNTTYFQQNTQIFGY